MTGTTGELAKALVAAQAALEPVAKRGRNPHFNSEFVTLDDLIAATRPVLNNHDLAINQFPTVHETGHPVLVTRITHVSGEFIEYAMPLLSAAANMQGLGAAITYARRFAWAAALGIASDTDDDGNTAAAAPADTPADRPARKPAPPTAEQKEQIAALLRTLDSIDPGTDWKARCVEITGGHGNQMTKPAATGLIRELKKHHERLVEAAQ